MLLGRHLHQAEAAANDTWAGSLYCLCVRNLLNPQPCCALRFCVCAGCIFQQLLGSRGLCFIKCVSALQAEVHSATVCLAVTQSIIWHFGQRLIFRVCFGFFCRYLCSYFLAVSSLHRICILSMFISHALKWSVAETVEQPHLIVSLYLARCIAYLSRNATKYVISLKTVWKCKVWRKREMSWLQALFSLFTVAVYNVISKPDIS